MITTDPNNPDIRVIEDTGMQKTYLVLSDEERAKGFVRPVRRTYVHIGEKPKYPLRDLTEEEKERYKASGYVAFETYPEIKEPLKGRYWSQQQLDAKGCGVATTMGLALSQTYARDPSFYTGTYCVGCQRHFPVAQFQWEDGEVVGS